MWYASCKKGLHIATPPGKNTFMFRNYLTVALRTLLKQKGYTLINTGSLAIGLVCFIMILLYVQHELSYDQFHEKKEHIYRVVQERPEAGGTYFWSVTSPALANTLKAEYSEVAFSTTIRETNNPLLSYEDRHYSEEGLLADKYFFDVFTFPMVRGNSETALVNPTSIILTETLAQTIFGDEDPMGKTITYQNADDFVVTGIIADPPETSHISFSYILPVESNGFYPIGITRPPWYNNGWFTYVVLHEGVTAAEMEANMKVFIDTNLSDWLPEDRMTFIFEPLADIHLNPLPIPDAFKPGGNIRYVYFFMAIGVLILLLACINYMNLALARSLKRAREVGMRKAIGALRSQLIAQFMGESVLLTMLALGISILFIHALLPFFSYLVERPLTLDYGQNIWLLPGLFILVIIVGALAGSYPALYMSGLRPIKILKGAKPERRSRIGLQKVLIVAQYTVSIILVAGSFVVFEQLQLIRDQDLGYDREHILTVSAGDRAISENYDQIREEWSNNPRVVSISYSRHLPINVGSRQTMFDWEGSEGAFLSTSTTVVEYDFTEVYGIELVGGRSFSRDFATDEDAVLINETAIHALGWTAEEALGKQFDFSDDKSGTLRTIIGVMKDFHFNSIHDQIDPLVLTLGRYPVGYISVRVRPEELASTLAMIEETIAPISPFPTEIDFMDDSFDALYAQEQRLGETFRFFTILALLIASMGLFGLAAYTAEERTKEIGVRKVLGASVRSIMLLLTSDFARLVIIAAVIAAPIAYFSMQGWLASFEYRIDIGPRILMLSIGLTFLIAVLSVLVQSMRAALTNPVKSLRYE